MVADWSELACDVLGLITGFLSLTDIHRFASVCRTWRLVAKQRRYPPLPQLPWLVLAEDETTKKRKLYNMSEKKHYLIDIPELRGAFCCGSSHGWLFAVGPKIEAYLVNPFSRARYLLPTLPPYGKGDRPYAEDESMVEYDEDGVPNCSTNKSVQQRIVRRVLLSADPSEGTDFVVLIILRGDHCLAFCRPGDREWTLFNFNGLLCDAIHFRNKFYMVDVNSNIYSIDFSPDMPMVTQIGIHVYHCMGMDMKHLVDLHGSLVLMARMDHYDDDSDPDKSAVDSFEICAVDLDEKKWRILASLGSKAVFIGANNAITVAASEFADCDFDTIYFCTDPCCVIGEEKYGYYDLGIYSLTEDADDMGHFYPADAYHPTTSLPLWLKPSAWIG